MLIHAKAGAGEPAPDPSDDPDRSDGVNIVGAVGEVLCSGVDIHRCAAARALGVIKDAGAVGPLIDALLDEDPDVRTDAADALASIGDQRAADQLLENLIGDPCSDVKLAAIHALAAMGYQDAVPWLEKFLPWHHGEIAWDEEEYYEGGWDSWVDLQIAAIKGLGQMGAAGAVPAIVEAIEDSDGQDLTETAFPVLARMGDAGIGALVRFLEGGDVRRRRRAVVALAGLDNAEARSAVLEALADPSNEVRLAAARALVDRNPNDALPVSLLGDPDPDLRALAARHCGRLSSETIRSLMDDPAEAVQAAAMAGIVDQPNDEITAEFTAWIEARLQGGGEEAACAAAAALTAIEGDGAADKLTKVLNDGARPLAVRLAALKELGDIAGSQAIIALAATLTDDERQIRMAALAALGHIAAGTDWPSAAGETLLAALVGELAPAPPPIEPAGAITPGIKEDGSATGETEDAEAYPTSSWKAIMGAGDARAELGDTRKNRVRLTQADMEYLALSKQTPRKGRAKLSEAPPAHLDLPRAAARVLGDVAEPEVVRELASALAAALSSGDEPLRQAAADSLAHIGEKLGGLPAEAFAELTRAVTDGDRACRHLAVRALGFTTDDETPKFLTGLLRDKDSFVRAEAINALARLGGGGVAFEDFLGDPERAVRLAAAGALAQCLGAAALDNLIEFTFAGNGHDRRDAARLLRGVDIPAANARFVAVLRDQDRVHERVIVLEAIAEINMT